MNKLTAKQEKFVLNVVSGMSQRAAYRDAYPNSKMKDSVVDVKASELLKSGKVKVRYDELMQEARKGSIWTLEKSVDSLYFMMEQAKEDILSQGVRQANSNAFIASVKELNTLMNIYEQSKLQNEYLKAKLELLKSDNNDLELLESLIEIISDK